MNMIMDSSHHQHQHQHQHVTPPTVSPQRADLHVSTTPPTPTPQSPASNHSHNNNNNNNNNNETDISPTAVTTTTFGNGKATLKRSFDVAFLMMPDERFKQKQHEKQARLADTIERHQYPTDLSPRSHQQITQQLQDTQNELICVQESPRRYPTLSIRAPRVYDDPSVIIPIVDVDSLPMKSAFTKVASTRLESPPTQPPAPPLSPDQLSCSSLSPPMATTPPRTNSGNGSLSNGSSNSTPSCLNPGIVYQSFRPEYQFNGAFQSVNQVQAMQAQRIKQQLFYRPAMNPSVNGHSGNGPAGPPPPPEFLHNYPGFPFAPGAAAHPFAAVAPPELPRIVQNPAAAAILSTLIPPTLASTFSLTAQNVCAKCNISFRMTSDLVYHMRSHHKSEVACDPNRRKREDKLKCPVCNESFRERHHLTRHMTAHQDKESDQTPNMPNRGANVNDQCLNVIAANSNRQHAARVNNLMPK